MCRCRGRGAAAVAAAVAGRSPGHGRCQQLLAAETRAACKVDSKTPLRVTIGRTPGHHRPAGGTNQHEGLRLAGTRVIVLNSCGQRRAAPQGREEIMIAKKAAKTAPRERSSAQNGMPEPVPYVYRAQKRRDTDAARIARRNAQGWWQPPVVPAP